jgi:3-dehydroquinate dehydratase II
MMVNSRKPRLSRGPLTDAPCSVLGVGPGSPGVALQPAIKDSVMAQPIYVLNGPNLNLLGEREPAIYGYETLADIEARCLRRAKQHDMMVHCFQSNYEGALVEKVHEARKQACGIIINPAGLSFHSIPLFDALKMFDGPKVEIHLSNIHQRDEIYHRSLVSKTAQTVICGLGAFGYELAVDAIHHLVRPS